MAGDISRSSFQRSKHNTGVRLQQGRVQLDADFNEQLDITAYLDRTLSTDLLGPSAAPSANPGFKITTHSNQLVINPGRLYANGLLCECEATATVTSTPVAGLPQQPDLPAYKAPSAAGDYLVYIDVWERDITALEDPWIREVALGGPDTATRKRLVWQVKLAPQQTLACTSDVTTLLPPASSGQMTAQAAPGTSANTPCAISATAGYRSLENQLYRVEIHTPGTAGPVGQATFKWSRDNATVVTAWQGQGVIPSQLTVSTLGKDNVLNFAAGQWVELLDDVHELNNQPGVLAQLTAAQLIAGVPTLTVGADTGSTTYSTYSGTPKVRRWDHTATSTTTGAVQLTEGAWIDLEDGVQIQFSHGGYYNTGDYWLIPARTATSASQPSLLWPSDASNTPLAQPPAGITHHYAPLAVAKCDGSGNWQVYSDCRATFPPLAQTATNVTSVATIEDNVPLTSGYVLSPDELLQGLKIACDQPLNPNALNAGTLSVSVDLPPWNGETTVTPSQLAAATAVKVMANYAVSTDSLTASWVPLPSARAYFYNELANLGVQTANKGQALVRLSIRTGAIRQGYIPPPSGDEPSLFALSLWTTPYCDPTDFTGYQPFLSVNYIVGPDASGDYVAMGRMSGAAFAQMLHLPLPSVSGRQLYSQPLTLWPGVRVLAYVPSPSERSGDFSNFSLPINDPNTGQPIINNHISPNEWPYSAYRAPGMPLERRDVELAEAEPAEHKATEPEATEPEAAEPEAEPAIPAPKEKEPAPSEPTEQEPTEPQAAPHAIQLAITEHAAGTVPVIPPTPNDRAGIFAWRFRAFEHPWSPYYGYGYGYGYGVSAAIGAELI